MALRIAESVLRKKTRAFDAKWFPRDERIQIGFGG
jgi:hypothetical protein